VTTSTRSTRDHPVQARWAGLRRAARSAGVDLPGYDQPARDAQRGRPLLAPRRTAVYVVMATSLRILSERRPPHLAESAAFAAGVGVGAVTSRATLVALDREVRNDVVRGHMTFEDCTRRREEEAGLQ
jgi:hypothetical protein